MKTEANGGGPCLGKPFEPNGVFKNDIEFLLMLLEPTYHQMAMARLAPSSR